MIGKLRLIVFVYKVVMLEVVLVFWGGKYIVCFKYVNLKELFYV